jgi:hypothetical protein
MNARDPLLPLQPDEASAIAAFAERSWDEQIVPALTDYIFNEPERAQVLERLLAGLRALA